MKTILINNLSYLNLKIYTNIKKHRKEVTTKSRAISRILLTLEARRPIQALEFMRRILELVGMALGNLNILTMIRKNQ